MLVTAIEEMPRGKLRIYIDGEYAFMLYRRDVSAYGLEVDAGISDELYRTIMEDTVKRRARQKALSLLERCDRSENELRRKLVLGMYTEDVVDDTVRYLYSHHYLDDARFAESYILSHRDAMSRLEIWQKLMMKGISRELFNAAYDSLSEDDPEAESQAAVKALKKRLGTKRTLDQTERYKIIGYMMRKGFKRNDILAAFESLDISISTEDIPD